MKISIAMNDGVLFDEAELSGVAPKAVRAALEDMLANLRLCQCEACSRWFPENEAVERDLDLYCPACR